MKINPDTKESSAPISVTFRNAKKYNYFGDFDEVTIEDADLDTVKAGPVFSAADGSCDNFALEYHMQI